MGTLTCVQSFFLSFLHLFIQISHNPLQCAATVAGVGRFAAINIIGDITHSLKPPGTGLAPLIIVFLYSLVRMSYCLQDITRSVRGR